MADGTSSMGQLSQNKCVFMKQCLSEWGLSWMIPIFEENKIDDGLFLSLTEEQIRELIPKEKYGFGPQWRFKKCHETMKNTVTIFPLSGGRDKSQNSERQEDAATGAAGTSGNIVSVLGIESNSADILGDDALLVEETISLSLEYNEDKENPTSSSQAFRVSIRSEETTSKKRALIDLTIGNKQGLRQQAHREVCDLDLHSLLESSINGLSILRSARQRGGLLEESDRTLLADILARWLLFRILDPTKIEFGILKDKILAEFPSESNVYYIPPRDEGPRQILARGKLFDRVRNVKDWMREKGLLPPTHIKKRRDGPQTAIASTSTADPLTISEDVETALLYLKSHREDWPKITEKWNLTSTYRMNKLQNESEGDKILEYMSEFKILRQKQGYTLLEIDFKQLYPGKEEALFAGWNKLREKLYQLLQNDTIKDTVGKHLASCLPECDNDDGKNIVVLQCLASLMPTSRLITIGKKKLKPSIDESRDAFILHVELPADLSPAMGRRRQRLVKFGAGASLQPYLAFVGEKRHIVKGVYVCIDTVAYKLDSVLQGLDVCFKSFFALNLKYPAEAEEVWLFLQQYVYGIKTSHYSSILKLTSFIAKLNAMDKKNPARKRR